MTVTPYDPREPYPLQGRSVALFRKRGTVQSDALTSLRD